MKGLISRKTHDSFGGCDLLVLDRIAVGAGRVRRRGSRGCDDRADNEKRRLVRDIHGPPNSRFECVEIFTDLAQFLDVPAVRPEAVPSTIAQRDLGLAVDRDVVVVVAKNHLAEAEMAGKRCGLMTDALREVAIAGDTEDVMVEDLSAVPRAELRFRNCHADHVGDALAERTGGDFNTRRASDFGMAWRGRSPLAEVTQVIEGQTKAGKVEERILQDRGMAGREHETVTIRPVGTVGVVAHDSAVQHMSQGSERHCRALVARACRVGGIHCQPADDAHSALIKIAHRSSKS